MTCPDNFFNIVDSANALGHVLKPIQPSQALKEMARFICIICPTNKQHFPIQSKSFCFLNLEILKHTEMVVMLSQYYKSHITYNKMKFTKYHKFGAYHWKMYEDKNTKYSRHADRVKEWIKEKNVLDIGAGDGKITHLLGIKGIDNEPEAVRLARERGADVVLGDAYCLPYKDEEFEAVFMGDTLEHLEFPEKALREARRVLKKYLYLATPEKGTNNDKFHYQEWTPEELKELVEGQGFVLEDEILVVPRDKRIYGKFKKV